jgi:hypothetical protein
MGHRDEGAKRQFQIFVEKSVYFGWLKNPSRLNIAFLARFHRKRKRCAPANLLRATITKAEAVPSKPE